MCKSVMFNGREFATPRQLASILGGEGKLVWKPDRAAPDPSLIQGNRNLDLCLCGVDLDATLTKAGMSWHPDVDPMQYIID